MQNSHGMNKYAYKMYKIPCSFYNILFTNHRKELTVYYHFHATFIFFVRVADLDIFKPDTAYYNLVRSNCDKLSVVNVVITISATDTFDFSTDISSK